MLVEMKLPELGENVAGGDVLQVLVAPGERVAREQALLEVETGKATLEIPSPAAGIVAELRVAKGDPVQVGQVLLTIEASEEPAAAGATAPALDPGEAAAGQSPDEPQSRAAASSAPEKPRPAAPPAPPAGGPEEARSPVFASPAVRRFAREIGVEIAAVTGTGPGGRISEEDVKTFARTRGPAAAPAAGVRRERMSRVRRETARALSAAWTGVPHVTLQRGADLTELERLRGRFKARVEGAGGKLTLTALLVKIAAGALQAHPGLNASLDLEREELIYHAGAHVGVAVDTPRGLVVPVIRDAQSKSVTAIAVELTRLAETARKGRLAPDDMAGGTFTVTNLGGLGVEHFNPVVNPPQAAILGVGRARPEPAPAPGGGWSERLRLPLSLSFDHRLVDGADGARFLEWVVEAIEAPLLLVLEGHGE